MKGVVPDIFFEKPHTTNDLFKKIPTFLAVQSFILFHTFTSLMREAPCQ